MSASQKKKRTKTQTRGGGEGDEHWSAGVREEKSQTYVSVGGRRLGVGGCTFSGRSVSIGIENCSKSQKKKREKKKGQQRI